MGAESIKYGDICDKCAHVEYCDMATFGGHNPRITACSHFSQLKQTNADRIRAMTDEELAVLLANTEANFPPNYPNGVSVKLCETSWLEWLKQEEGG